MQHGSTGLMVSPSDPGALAAALDGLLDNPELRQRMGEAGRVRARQFEVAAVAQRIVKVFEEALLSRSRVSFYMRSNISISGGWEYCANGVAHRRSHIRSRFLHSAVLFLAGIGCEPGRAPPPLRLNAVRPGEAAGDS